MWHMWHRDTLSDTNVMAWKRLVTACPVWSRARQPARLPLRLRLCLRLCCFCKHLVHAGQTAAHRRGSVVNWSTLGFGQLSDVPCPTCLRDNIAQMCLICVGGGGERERENNGNKLSYSIAICPSTLNKDLPTVLFFKGNGRIQNQWLFGYIAIRVTALQNACFE